MKKSTYNYFRRTKMKIKLIKSFFVLFAGLIFFGAPVVASEKPTIEQIVAAVKNAENSVQDLTVEYTATMRPYGSKGRDLTTDEQKVVDKFPGRYKTQSGVFTIKGDKMRLEYLAYPGESTEKQYSNVLTYDGQTTINQNGRYNTGLVTAGLSHHFRLAVNPWRAVTVGGDMKLSKELEKMNPEVISELEEVNGTPCQVVKLYKKNAGRVMRSYKVYLDPSSNYAVKKIEKFWYSFKRPETVMEVNEFSKVSSNVYFPSKVLLVYHDQSSSKPTHECEIDITKISVDKNVSDSVFTQSFWPGARVWDDILKMNVKISN